MQIKALPVLCLALAGTGAFAQTKAPEPDYTFAYTGRDTGRDGLVLGLKYSF